MTRGHIETKQIEIEMIESVIHHEVGYCSEESKIAITNIILNRVQHEDFPDTVEEVLKQEGQFTAIHNYYDQELIPDDSTREAVSKALQGTDNSQGALYYYAPEYVSDQSIINWFENELTFLFELEGQRYFK